MIKGISNLRIRMYKDLPTEFKINKIIKEQMKKMKEADNKSTESAPPKQRKAKIKDKNIDINSYSTQTPKKKKRVRNRAQKGNFTNTEQDFIYINIDKENKEEEIKDEKQEERQDYNKFPFSQAVREDKRNISQILISLITDKIEFFSYLFVVIILNL